MITKHLSMQTIHHYLPTASLMHFGEVFNVALKNLVTDSRSLEAGDFFIALQGERFDAHDFLGQVQTQGAIGSLVSNPSKVPEAFPAIVVEDTLIALGEIAKAWRQELAQTVVLVTGSNGKTTVKEMIASIFRAAVGEKHSLATKGNLNNAIGLPLTLLRMTSEHQFATIELGMNHPGETKQLAEIASPNIVLVNNAQREHQEFMQTVEAVASEHALAILALPIDGIAIFPQDSQYVDIWRKACGTRMSLEFVLVQNPADLQNIADVVGVLDTEGALEILAKPWQDTVKIRLQTLGLHNAKNALAAVAVGIAAGVSKEAIINGLEQFEAVNGRMQKLEMTWGSTPMTLIDDTYNANPDSVIAAIDAIQMLGGRHWLVLGDMGEVGNQGPEFHEEIGRYAALHTIENMFTVGELTQHSMDAFNASAGKNSQQKHFMQMDDLLKHLMIQIEAYVANHSASDTKSLATKSPLVILVKGSRFMKMERVIQAIIHLTNKKNNSGDIQCS